MADDSAHPPGPPQRTSGVRAHHSETSDAALAVSIARYDQSALAEVYRRHAGAVYGLAKRLLFEQALAEEVVQEVFLRLWHDPGRFDADRGSMRSFLLTQSHGRAVDIVRADTARRRREERDARDTASAGYDVELQAWDLSTSDRVRRSLEALPVHERRAITLAYFGGYTYKEVAERLGEPAGTIKSRIRSGLRRLRAELLQAGITVETSDG